MSFYKLSFISTFILLFGHTSCQQNEKVEPIKSDSELLHESVKLITTIIVDDIFSPPVASRIYVYSLLAAYEVSKFQNSTAQSFESKLKGLENLPKPDFSEEYDFNLAANLALLYTSSKLIFTSDSVEIRVKTIIEQYGSKGLKDAVKKRSILFAKSMSEAILKYASEDNYKKTRSFAKYEAKSDVSVWKPTPPAYIDGIEPHWSEIRPLVMDSSSQFRPKSPTPFDTISQSKFMENALEVYHTVNEATEEQKLIADYWDCNPYKVNISGHVMHASKKITPGGHWINITGLACQQKQLNMFESLYAYSLVAIGIFDGFISCWDEKYRSNLLRPETYINQFIDKNWKPLLQTPPFPEYTSGHSVISTISGDILTEIFAENFAFTDNTGIVFGLPLRNFKSFNEAAAEAAISRLYAGIHYRPAIENGILQGHKIAKHLHSQILN